MKIYRFPNFTGPDGYSKNIGISSNRKRQPIKPAAGGEDMVIISPEAREKFLEDNLVRMDRYLIKKDAERLKNITLEKIKFDEKNRAKILTELKNRIKLQEYEFSNTSVLKKSAEGLALFYTFN